MKKVTKKSRKNEAATLQNHPASRFFIPPAVTIQILSIAWILINGARC
jgi:hypothetical protein